MTPVTELSRLRFVPSDQVIAQVVGSETVILHIPTERFVTLDEIGADMWRAGSDSATVAEAIGSLLNEYDVERSVLEADFVAFAERLAGLELAQLTPVV